MKQLVDFTQEKHHQQISRRGVKTVVEVIFLTSLFTGVAGLIGAVSVARIKWRPDVAPFSRQHNVFKVLAQPQEYALPSAVGRIRAFTYIGYALLGLAIASLAWQFWIDFIR